MFCAVFFRRNNRYNFEFFVGRRIINRHGSERFEPLFVEDFEGDLVKRRSEPIGEDFDDAIVEQ